MVGPAELYLPGRQRWGLALNGGFCKHIIAVLLDNDELGFQLLDVLLRRAAPGGPMARSSRDARSHTARGLSSSHPEKPPVAATAAARTMRVPATT